MKTSMGMVGETQYAEDEANHYVSSLKVEEEEKEEGEEEESGWTSYLDTDQSSSYSSILLSESSSYNYSNTFIDNDNCRTSSCNNYMERQNSTNNNNKYHNSCYNYMVNDDQIVAQNGHTVDNMDDGGFAGGVREAALPDQESLGSSTLSDASSNLGQSNRNSDDFNTVPIKRFCARLPQKHQKFKRNRCNFPQYSTNCMLQDTASSPPSQSAQDKLKGEGDVSKRFKALEALIPRLKEVAGKATEEEMLNVIISHVQTLELKVELLSNLWRLSRPKYR